MIDTVEYLEVGHWLGALWMYVFTWDTIGTMIYECRCNRIHVDTHGYLHVDTHGHLRDQGLEGKYTRDAGRSEGILQGSRETASCGRMTKVGRIRVGYSCKAHPCTWYTCTS